MIKRCLMLLALAGAASAQLPPPPPLVPQPMPGQPAPFNPDQTREALPQAPLEMPRGRLNGPLPVAEAVRMALELQPAIQAARGRLRQLEGTTQVQRSNLLPNISGRSQYRHLSTSSAISGLNNPGLGGNQDNNNTTAGNPPTATTRTTDQFINNVGINQLLFDWGRTRSLVKEADLRRQAAAAAVLVSENDTALAVKEAYYQALQAQRLLRVAEGDLANRQEQLRLTRALYQSGGISPGDVVRAQTTVSNSVFALNNARRNLEVALQDLALAMGLPPLTTFELLDTREPDLPNKDVRSLTDEAAVRRPDLLVAERNVEASKAGLDAAHTLNYPALSTFAGITYQGLTNGVQYPSFNLQLNLDFTLYDGGQRAGAIRQAEGTLEQDLSELERTQLEVEREVTGVYAQLVAAERNVEAARAAVDSARQGVRIAVGRYQAALGTLTDVLDTQNQLVSAQTNYSNALLELDLARSRMRHALAAPLEEGFFPAQSPTP